MNKSVHGNVAVIEVSFVFLSQFSTRCKDGVSIRRNNEEQKEARDLPTEKPKRETRDVMGQKC